MSILSDLDHVRHKTHLMIQALLFMLIPGIAALLYFHKELFTSLAFIQQIFIGMVLYFPLFTLLFLPAMVVVNKLDNSEPVPHPDDDPFLVSITLVNAYICALIIFFWLFVAYIMKTGFRLFVMEVAATGIIIILVTTILYIGPKKHLIRK